MIRIAQIKAIRQIRKITVKTKELPMFHEQAYSQAEKKINVRTLIAKQNSVSFKEFVNFHLTITMKGEKRGA